MIHLTLPWIKTYAGSDDRFRSGFMLYQKQRISGVEAGAKNGLNLTVSMEGEDLTVSLYFYPDTGTFKYAKCDCHQSQPCEHVIGALLYVLYKQDALAESLNTSKTHKMYDAFEKLLIDNSTNEGVRHLGLEVIISPRDVFSKTQNSSIQLKVNHKSSYLVKQVASFVKAICQGKSYEVTKQFVYEPGKFVFDLVDRKVIELLYDYYSTRSHMISSSGGQLMTPLKASVQTLPGTYMTRLLDILDGHSFNIDFDGLYFRKQQIEEGPEVDFHLMEEKNSYLLSINTYDIFFPITEDYRYIFYNNQIYRIGPREQEAFKLFRHYLAEKAMVVDNEHLEDFINKVMPVLELIGYVHLDDSISDRLEKYPLEASVYIEKEAGELALRLTYQYGPYEFLRYPEVYHDTGFMPLVLHHLEKEKSIEGLLQEPKHHIDDQGRLHYDSEEDMFYFIDRILPRLQGQSNVYYSDDFRHTYMRTKKELVSTVNYNAAGNLLELDFEMVDVSREELMSLLQAIREKKHYYRLRDGSFFSINESLTDQVAAIDHRFGLALNAEEGPLVSTTMANAFYLDNLLNDDGRAKYSRSFGEIIDSMKNSHKADFVIPEVVEEVLRDYQKTGFKWLVSLQTYGLGGILADDMGLGKTLQAITLMLSSESNRPSIVVAPTSLIYNWEEEIHKFAPEICTKVVVGTKNQRQGIIGSIGEREIIITSYGSLKRDLESYEDTFEYCIIDEAQHIKNPRSQNARAVKSIPARHRYALTGTPIENTLTELWSIFDFVLPGYLGSHDHFMKSYERPIIKENDTELLARLTQLIHPFILRRLKEDVLSELPPKIETKVSVELNSQQKKLYMAYVQQAKNDVAAYGNLPEGQKNMKILSVLTRLRQLCCHPSLFVADYKHGASKLELLLELVQDSLEGGHRVLVFSQFTSMLALMRQMLDKHHIDYHYLDGSVPPVKRQQMVHDFNGGINDVFLISLKAGGTGLNLTGADVVIHYDPWWNPAVENQATDRAYRIGQRNRVQVYKLITSGTIEEKIWQLQQKKLNLIDNVIKPGETFLNKLTVSELQSLFLDG